jgi:hypothetical protein
MNEVEQEAEEVFSFRTNRDGHVTIRWCGRAVTILRGKAAARFLTRVEGSDPSAVQLEMAKVTGNFKRGNERLASSGERRKHA